MLVVHEVVDEDTMFGDRLLIWATGLSILSAGLCTAQFVWVTKKYVQAMDAETTRIIASTDAIRAEIAMYSAATDAYNATASRSNDSVVDVDDPPSTPPPTARS